MRAERCLGASEELYTRWMRKDLGTISLESLLRERWILDMDVTVKPLYRHQEAAVKETTRAIVMTSHEIGRASCRERVCLYV